MFGIRCHQLCNFISLAAFKRCLKTVDFSSYATYA